MFSVEVTTGEITTLADKKVFVTTTTSGLLGAVKRKAAGVNKSGSGEELLKRKLPAVCPN